MLKTALSVMECTLLCPTVVRSHFSHSPFSPVKDATRSEETFARVRRENSTCACCIQKDSNFVGKGSCLGAEVLYTHCTQTHTAYTLLGYEIYFRIKSPRRRLRPKCQAVVPKFNEVVVSDQAVYHHRHLRDHVARRLPVELSPPQHQPTPPWSTLRLQRHF